MESFISISDILKKNFEIRLKFSNIWKRDAGLFLIEISSTNISQKNANAAKILNKILIG